MRPEAEFVDCESVEVCESMVGDAIAFHWQGPTLRLCITSKEVRAGLPLLPNALSATTHSRVSKASSFIRKPALVRKPATPQRHWQWPWEQQQQRPALFFCVKKPGLFFFWPLCLLCKGHQLG